MPPAQSSMVAARPVSSAFSGRCTVSLKTLLPEEMSLDFERYWRKGGYTSGSDCLRELLAIAMYGKEKVDKVHTDRTAVAAMNLAETLGEPTAL